MGSIKGAFIAGVGLGIVDTMLRAFLPQILGSFLPPADAQAVGGGVSSMGIYLLMALVLLVRPKGLFPAEN